MGIKEQYQRFTDIFRKEVRAFNSSNTTPVNRLPQMPTWVSNPLYGVPRMYLNVWELRQYSKAPWVQMVLNAIKKQIMSTDWDIVPTDEQEDVSKYKEQVDKIKQLLLFPNRNGETFWEVWGAFLHDVLESDGGVIYKGRNPEGDLVELFSYDGSTFLIDLDQHKIIQKYYQYSYKAVASNPIPFKPDEIIYGAINRSNETYPYGFSPLQSVLQVVELLIQSTRHNKDFFQNNGIPDAIVGLKTDDVAMERIKSYWQTEVQGRPHKTMFLNVPDLNVQKLATTNREMEWLAGQKWYLHSIFAAYGLSPQEVGYYENSNKSTGESQERITIKNAIRPYLQLIEDKINREIIPELIGSDALQFKWFPQDDVAEKVEFDQTIAKLNAHVYTINEVRAMEGLDPVEWGDEPLASIGQPQPEKPEDKPEDDQQPQETDETEEQEDAEEPEAVKSARELYSKLWTGFVNKNG